MTRITTKKAWLAIVLALLTIIVVTPVVFAHATLLRSDPADNSILTDPPREIRLWFSEPISPEFSSAEILDINGQPVKISGIRIDPADPTLMILTLPKLPEGLYSIRWKVLSEADGHFTQGPLVFGVGEGLDLSKAAPVESKATVPPPEVILRWFNYTLLLALVGSIVVTWLVLTPKSMLLVNDIPLVTIRRKAQRRALLLATLCGGLAWVVGLGLLAWQAINLLSTLPDSATLLGVTWQVISKTRWGTMWLARQAILLLLMGVIFRLYQIKNMSTTILQHSAKPKSSLALPLLAGLLMLVSLLIQSLVSHAAAATPNTALAIVVDVLHLLAASIWVGGLLALVVALVPLFRGNKQDFGTLVRATWRPFSRIAVLSVVVLFATGLYSTGRHVASIDALITTLYGQILLGKVGLMLVVGAIGLFNAILLHPSLAAPLAQLLRRPPGWTPLSIERLPLLVLTEASLGLLILLATSLITAAPTARGPQFEMLPDEIPTALSQSVDDLVITFSAKPNRPGQNVFVLRAASIRRPPPAEVLRVMLRFTFLGQEMGRSSVDLVEVEPGLYQIGGNQLSLAGPWQVQAVVRRGGIEDSVAEFNWAVAPAGKTRPVVISKQPLESLLTFTSAIIILMISVGMAGLWLIKRRFITPSSFQYKVHQSERVFTDESETDLDIKANFVVTARPASIWLWRWKPTSKTKSIQRGYDL